VRHVVPGERVPVTCLTPGAVYNLKIQGKKIIYEVTLPPDVRMPTHLAPLKVALHNAMEGALVDLFFHKRIKGGNRDQAPEA
jgi:hypothetical protein